MFWAWIHSLYQYKIFDFKSHFVDTELKPCAPSPDITVNHSNLTCIVSAIYTFHIYTLNWFDLSRTHLKGLRGIKIKGKRGTNLHENTIIWEKNFYLKTLFSISPFINVQEDPRNNKSIESGIRSSSQCNSI